VGSDYPGIYIEQDRGHLISLHNAKATKNPLVEKIYSFILEYFEFSIQKTHESPENRKNVLPLNREIVEALESRDVERTIAIIKESIVDWIKRTETH
jgi:DNA-binding FadR family transcriptional regulator